MKDTILSWTSVHWPEQSSIDLFVEHQLFVVLFPWRLEQNGKNRPLHSVLSRRAICALFVVMVV